VKKRQNLPIEIKDFIIEQFAGGELSNEVERMVVEAFGVAVPGATIRSIKMRKQAEIYQRRMELEKELHRIPIANIYYRMKQRQELFEKAKKIDHLNLMNKILDSAAEEFKIMVNVQVNSEINNILNTSYEDFEKFLLKQKG